MAGADLANLVNEGALLAARRNHDKIYMADLEEAKDKVMLGAERKSLVMKEEERRLTAYHEAGHAVCAMTVKGNDPLHKVTIVPRGRALGLAFTLPEDDRVSVTREQIEARLAMAYGGRVGRGDDLRPRPRDDRRGERHPAGDGHRAPLRDAVGIVGRDRSDPRRRQRAGGLPRPRAACSRREVSEQTAQLVDAEVKRVIDQAYNAREGGAHGAHRAAAQGCGGAARARDADARGHRGASSERATSASDTDATNRPGNCASADLGAAPDAADHWRAGAVARVAVARVAGDERERGTGNWERENREPGTDLASVPGFF